MTFFSDCDEKIKRAENIRKIHNSWVKEAEEVMTGEAGDQLEIVEELTEEEFQMSKGTVIICVIQEQKMTQYGQ